MIFEEMEHNKYTINIRCTVVEALGQLNELSGGVMTLFGVDEQGKLRGAVTDGDIRRGLLRGVGLEAAVSEVMNGRPVSLRRPFDLDALRGARERGIRILPVIDAEGVLVDILDLTRQESALPLSAILMAGGRGERLRPATLTRPKPLLEIGGRPIIDYNIERLARAGIGDVSVCVNYLAEQIEEYFAKPRWGIDVKCVREPEFMGTIGAAALVGGREPGGATLVMNSDLLTTISLEEMFLQHRDSGASVTIAAVPYTVSVPYAIMETDARGRVSALQEKPTYSHMANAGIYIFANSVLESLPPKGRTDAPDLIERVIAEGGTVQTYPIAGTWIDIGTPTDFRHAEELMHQVSAFK